MAVRVGIVGLGRMGSHHARICAAMESVQLVAVCDVDGARSETADEYGCEFLSDYTELAGRVDAVIVAVPTSSHREVGGFFLRNGTPVLIEKPMAGTVEDADAILAAAEEGNAMLHVGHVERFNPAVIAIEHFVTQPLFIECTRISPYPFRSSDVGVVFDVMIHDIDIVLHLCRSEVASMEAVGVKVLSASEDIANVRIIFESGCVANVTASRVSLKKERQIRIFQHDSYVSLDYETRKIKHYMRRPGAENLDVSSLAAEDVGDPVEFVYKKLLSVDEIEPEDYDPLEKEIETFIRCVAGETLPAVTGEHGRRAVAVAQRIREKLDEGSGNGGCR